MLFSRLGRIAGLSGAIVLAMAPAALAHPGHAGHGFSDGWSHPLLGWDHLLAMVAVGLLAVRFGGHALWMLPGAFLTAMSLGGGLALAGIDMPAVEIAIAASVIVVGLLIASAATSLPLTLLLVAAFALFHGFAHGAEMPPGIAAAGYVGGFLLSTAALHVAGVLGGLAITAWAKQIALRVSGGLIATAGVLLAFWIV